MTNTCQLIYSLLAFPYCKSGSRHQARSTVNINSYNKWSAYCAVFEVYLGIKCLITPMTQRFLKFFSSVACPCWSVAVSMMRRQRTQSLAFFQAEWIPTFADRTSASIPLSQVVRRRPRGPPSRSPPSVGGRSDTLTARWWDYTTHNTVHSSVKNVCIKQ